MADFEFITQTGVVVPDTAQTLAEVQGEYQAAFGTELDLSPETPQGVLISMEVDARDGAVRMTAEAANQINPNLAGGVWLDALFALMGGQRTRATRSQLDAVELGGVPGAVIPAGSRARVAGSGALFELAGAVALNPSGRGVGTFLSVDFGPVDAAPGALSEIATVTLGWETVSNPAAPALGRFGETDAQTRLRRRQMLGRQSTGLIQSVRAGLLDTSGVRSCQVRENYTDAAITIDGITLAPHSIYAAVDGGTDADVAATLLDRKSLGAGFNGATEILVVEPASGQTYAVKFDRPDLIDVFVRVRIAAGSPLADPANSVRDAILRYVNGEQAGEEGLGVGRTVSAFELAGAINRDFPQVFVRGVGLGTSPGTFTETEIPIAINQRASIISGNIMVVVE